MGTFVFGWSDRRRTFGCERSSGVWWFCDSGYLYSFRACLTDISGGIDVAKDCMELYVQHCIFMRVIGQTSLWGLCLAVLIDGVDANSIPQLQRVAWEIT
jgi:hypothetical protein